MQVLPSYPKHDLLRKSSNQGSEILPGNYFVHWENTKEDKWLREKSITQANSGRRVLQGIPPWERWEKQELQLWPSISSPPVCRQNLSVCVWEWIREQQGLIWYHSMVHITSAGWVGDREEPVKSLGTLLFTSPSLEYIHTEEKASRLLVIFTLHAHTYIKINTQTHRVSLWKP